MSGSPDLRLDFPSIPDVKEITGGLQIFRCSIGIILGWTNGSGDPAKET